MSRKEIQTILIVDDNRDSADSLALLIQHEGHKTLRAYDTRSGLDLAEKTRPDIIFHDIRMPDIDGYMAARQLRS